MQKRWEKKCHSRLRPGRDERFGYSGVEGPIAARMAPLAGRIERISLVGRAASLSPTTEIHAAVGEPRRTDRFVESLNLKSARGQRRCVGVKSMNIHYGRSPRICSVMVPCPSTESGKRRKKRRIEKGRRRISWNALLKESWGPQKNCFQLSTMLHCLVINHQS